MIHCPKCGSDVVYRYGFSKTGKQKYQCQICLHQFVVNPSKKFCEGKPTCPICGAPMYVHSRRKNGLTYRCSHYPDCKGYVSSKCG